MKPISFGNNTLIDRIKFHLDDIRIICLFSDFDECSIMTDLCKNGRCINTLGSFRCECFPGYYYDTGTHICAGKDMNCYLYYILWEPMEKSGYMVYPII